MNIKITILFYLFSGLIYSQRIVDFKLSANATAVGIRFTITRGSSCDGYSVMHGTDSLHLTRVYEFAGICGDPGTDQPNSYTHANPALNKTNYYRIDLPPFERSSIRSTFIADPTNQELTIFPNPVGSTNKLSIRFGKTNATKFTGFIYNQFGQPIRELTFTSGTQENFLDVASIINGAYLIWLTDGEKSYSTKVLISR
jgi:Secretion system C-terminal sorting domain